MREPEGNGVERFIRTLKENLLWVRRFDTIEELRRTPLEFQRLYNHTWIVEPHGYRTPAQVRADQLGTLAAAARVSAVSQICGPIQTCLTDTLNRDHSLASFRLARSPQPAQLAAHAVAGPELEGGVDKVG